MENLKILSRAMHSNSALATVIFPALSYPFLTAQLGLWVATLILSVYCILIDIKLNVLGNFAYIFLLIGVIDLAITIVVPANYLVDVLAIKEQIYSIQNVFVLVVFMLIKKPIPMMLAEAFAPELKVLRNEHSNVYFKVFQTISLVWVAAYLAKALLFQLVEDSESFYSMVRASTGWPLTVVLAYFTIAYSRKQLEHLRQYY